MYLFSLKYLKIISPLVCAFLILYNYGFYSGFFDDWIYIRKYFEIPDRFYLVSKIDENYKRNFESGKMAKLPIEDYHVDCTALANQSAELEMAQFPFLKSHYGAYRRFSKFSTHTKTSFSAEFVKNYIEEHS